MKQKQYSLLSIFHRRLVFRCSRAVRFSVNAILLQFANRSRTTPVPASVWNSSIIENTEYSHKDKGKDNWPKVSHNKQNEIMQDSVATQQNQCRVKEDTILIVLVRIHPRRSVRLLVIFTFLYIHLLTKVKKQRNRLVISLESSSFKIH